MAVAHLTDWRASGPAPTVNRLAVTRRLDVKRVLIAISLVTVVVVGVVGHAESPAKSPIAGVWKITDGGPGGGRGGAQQPSLWLFTDKHFSRISNQGLGERAAFKNPGAPTAEDKAAAYDSFNANAGTYDIKGNTIVFHVQLAKSQGIVGQDLEQEVEVKGSTLTVKNPNNGVVFRLTRVE